MKKYLFAPLVTLLFLLTLVACAPASAPDPASAPAAVPAEASQLPVDIDVQTAAAFKEDATVVWLDVREQSEYDAGHIPGITLMPMGEVASRLSEIPKDKQVIVACQSGGRSSQVVAYLQEQGFINVHNLLGGFGAWERAKLPVER